MLGPRLLLQLAHVTNCEWWSESDGSSTSPLMNFQVSKLWQKLWS